MLDVTVDAKLLRQEQPCRTENQRQTQTKHALLFKAIPEPTVPGVIVYIPVQPRAQGILLPRGGGQRKPFKILLSWYALLLQLLKIN